jgi:hypothetical protein
MIVQPEKNYPANGGVFHWSTGQVFAGIILDSGIRDL